MILALLLAGCGHTPARHPLFAVFAAHGSAGSSAWELVDASTGEVLGGRRFSPMPWYIAYHTQTQALYAATNMGQQLVRLWPPPEQLVFTAPGGLEISELVAVPSPARILARMNALPGAQGRTERLVSIDLTGGGSTTTVSESPEPQLSFWQGGVDSRTGAVLGFQRDPQDRSRLNLIEISPRGAIRPIQRQLTLMGRAPALGPSLVPAASQALVPQLTTTLIVGYPSSHGTPQSRRLPWDPCCVLASPNGTKVAYPVEIGGVRCVVAGASEHAVSRHAYADVSQVWLDWAPTSDRVALMVERVSQHNRKSHTVYVIEAATGADREVYRREHCAEADLAWASVSFRMPAPWVTQARPSRAAAGVRLFSWHP